jgi:hypothetical protein
MNTIRRIHHLAAILAASACAVLGLAMASPAMAMTISLPHPGPSVPGAAVLTALLAVAADRAHAARRQVTAPTL